MRILHLTDRLTSRGGAHRHLRSIAAWQISEGHDVVVAAGRDDGEAPACATRLIPGLDARDAHAVDLDATLSSVRPEIVHLHTIVNPCVLEQARGWPALITVQDHRYFCPGRGK